MMKHPLKLLMLILIIVAAIYVGQGIAMHQSVSSMKVEYHRDLHQYYSQSKSVRDAAPTDSELANQLVRIQQTPSQLMELKLVGVGKILTGIAALLLGILLALVSLPMRLQAVMKAKK